MTTEEFDLLLRRASYRSKLLSAPRVQLRIPAPLSLDAELRERTRVYLAGLDRRLARERLYSKLVSAAWYVAAGFTAAGSSWWLVKWLVKR